MSDDNFDPTDPKNRTHAIELFVVRWDEEYLGPEHAKEMPPDPRASSVSLSNAAQFHSYEAAAFALSRCNNGWRRHAVIERVFDPPGPTP